MAIHPALTRFFDPLVQMGRWRGPLKVTERAEMSGMEGAVDFEFTGDDGWVWHCQMERGRIQFRRGGALNPRGTISMSADTFVKLLKGDLLFSTASMTGRVRTRGDGHVSFVAGVMVARFRAPEKEKGVQGFFANMWRKRVIQAMSK